MIESLGYILERSLGKAKECATLDEEINCLRHYVELQKMRYGNQSVPKDLYEAARIDGASGIQAFKSVTVPTEGRERLQRCLHIIFIAGLTSGSVKG